MENVENTENMEKMVSTIFMIQNTEFVNRMAKNSLFYGFYGDSWKNHNISAWRKWSLVSLRWGDIKQNVEPFFLPKRITFQPTRTAVLLSS